MERLRLELQVTFVSKNGRPLGQVPFTRQAVDNHAKSMAEKGFSIMDERGKHWLWDECYNVLVETETRKLIVVGSARDHTFIEEEYLEVESGMHKRRDRSGQLLIGNRVSDRELPHKLRGQQVIIKEKEEDI